MFLEKKSISAYNANQIAYPVGPEKDSYTIVSWLRQDINTLEYSSEHHLVKNHMNNEKDPTKNYKPGAKFRETLFKGTYKECQDFFINNILPNEWEWVRDEKLNYVYPEK